MARFRFLSASALAMALSVVLAGSALAAPPITLVKNDRFSFSFIDDEICPGLLIHTAFDVKATRTIYYDDEGNELRLVIHVKYWGTFTNVDEPSISLNTPGTRNITFDFVNQTRTETGVYRNVAVKGGNVLLEAGRWMETLDESQILSISGPHQDLLGDLADFCAALGG